MRSQSTVLLSRGLAAQLISFSLKIQICLVLQLSSMNRSINNLARPCWWLVLLWFLDEFSLFNKALRFNILRGLSRWILDFVKGHLIYNLILLSPALNSAFLLSRILMTRGICNSSALDILALHILEWLGCSLRAFVKLIDGIRISGSRAACLCFIFIA